MIHPPMSITSICNVLIPAYAYHILKQRKQLLRLSTAAIEFSLYC